MEVVIIKRATVAACNFFVANSLVARNSLVLGMILSRVSSMLSALPHQRRQVGAGIKLLLLQCQTVFSLSGEGGSRTEWQTTTHTLVTRAHDYDVCTA